MKTIILGVLTLGTMLTLTSARADCPDCAVLDAKGIQKDILDIYDVSQTETVDGLKTTVSGIATCSDGKSIGYLAISFGQRTSAIGPFSSTSAGFNYTGTENGAPGEIL